MLVKERGHYSRRETNQTKISCLCRSKPTVTPLRPKQEPEITVGVHQYKLRRFGHKAMWGNGGCQKSLRGQQAKLLILCFFYNSGRETCMAMTPFIQAHLIFFRGMGNV